MAQMEGIIKRISGASGSLLQKIREIRGTDGIEKEVGDIVTQAELEKMSYRGMHGEAGIYDEGITSYLVEQRDGHEGYERNDGQYVVTFKFNVTWRVFK